VSIEDVAERPRVSHGLLYRYFPSKRAFFAAVAQAEGANLLRASAPDPALSPLDQMRAGLDVYIAQAESSPAAYRMSHQARTNEEQLGSMHQACNTTQRDRILNNLTAVIPTDDEIPLAITAWLGFAQTAILGWIDNPAIPRQQLHDLCIRALCAAGKLPTPREAP
jgi:AcrR family transcriptional regulator